MSGPWWEDIERRSLLIIEALNQWPFDEPSEEADHRIVRLAASRAVETHGHVVGCKCVLVEVIAKSFFTGEDVLVPAARDPRCLTDAKP